MTGKEHNYALTTTWTGNRGTGTSGYRDYGREHEIRVPTKPDQVLLGSADPTFRGDAARYNPEELLVAALSQCHLLSYLHACVMAGVVVTGYTDEATGTMITTPDGGGRFEQVTLHPVVTIDGGSDPEAAERAHRTANQLCFIANSVNFEVRHEPRIIVED